MLDNIDLSILKEFADDARKSYRELAKKLGVSPATIHERVKKLKNVGIIRKFAVQVDYDKLGFKVTAIIQIKAEGKNIVSLEEDLAELPNVVAVYDINGEYDVFIIAKFRDFSELNKFIKDLQKRNDIGSTNIVMAFKVVKEDFSSLLASQI